MLVIAISNINSNGLNLVDSIIIASIVRTVGYLCLLSIHGVVFVDAGDEVGEVKVVVRVICVSKWGDTLVIPVPPLIV